MNLSCFAKIFRFIRLNKDSFWTTTLQNTWRRKGNKWIIACVELAAKHSSNLFHKSLHKGKVVLVVK